jgi:PAS domain-containing protein
VGGGLPVSRASSEQLSAETGGVVRDGGSQISEQQLLRFGFDRAPSGMSAVALDGSWLRINDAYCRLLGYEPEELLGASCREVTHADDVNEDRDFLRCGGRGWD